MFGSKFSTLVGPEGQKRQKVAEHKTTVLDAFNLDRPEHPLETSRRKSIEMKKLDTIYQEQDADSKEDSPTKDKEQNKDSDL